jgi:N-acetylglutamate synthase-like GNAT family acetyltransferase
MESNLLQSRYTLRPAASGDAKTIRQLINLVQINPTGLSWKRFILAVDARGKVIGCGQIKPHRDGSWELASIAVLPEWRGKGVARHIIEHLLQHNPGRLYLTCRSQLEPLYRKFGFQAIDFTEMPPYFQQISRLAALYNKLAHQPGHLSVMRRD